MMFTSKVGISKNVLALVGAISVVGFAQTSNGLSIERVKSGCRGALRFRDWLLWKAGPSLWKPDFEAHQGMQWVLYGNGEWRTLENVAEEDRENLHFVAQVTERAGDNPAFFLWTHNEKQMSFKDLVAFFDVDQLMGKYDKFSLEYRLEEGENIHEGVQHDYTEILTEADHPNVTQAVHRRLNKILANSSTIKKKMIPTISLDVHSGTPKKNMISA